MIVNIVCAYSNSSFLILLCCENRTYSCRAAMVPVHASFGVATFMMAVATCVTGLVEKERQLVQETPADVTTRCVHSNQITPLQN